MKKLVALSILAALLVTPVMAVPTLEFAKNNYSGGWFYDGAGTFTFPQETKINAVEGGGSDALYGMYVYLPSMTVSGSAGNWTLSGGTIAIRSTATGTGDILVGTLGTGNLVPNGTAADGYTASKIDITWTFVNAGFSPVTDKLFAAVTADMDLGFSATGIDLAYPGGTFEKMLETKGMRYNDGLTGSISATIPAPGAILLAGIGTSLVGWLRRKRAL